MALVLAARYCNSLNLATGTPSECAHDVTQWLSDSGLSLCRCAYKSMSIQYRTKVRFIKSCLSAAQNLVWVCCERDLIDVQNVFDPHVA